MHFDLDDPICKFNLFMGMVILLTIAYKLPIWMHRAGWL